jgi:hypothetical protein
MDTKTLEQIESVVGGVIASYVREVKLLGERLAHAERQIVLLKMQERGRRNRELVAPAEDDDE